MPCDYETSDSDCKQQNGHSNHPNLPSSPAFRSLDPNGTNRFHFARSRLGNAARRRRLAKSRPVGTWHASSARIARLHHGYLFWDTMPWVRNDYLVGTYPKWRHPERPSMQHGWSSFLRIYGCNRPVSSYCGHSWKDEQSELVFAGIGSCTDLHRADFHRRVADPSSFRLIGLIQTPSKRELNSVFCMAKCDRKGFLHGCKQPLQRSKERKYHPDENLGIQAGYPPVSSHDANV